jgi:hypothetical protein
VQSRNDRLAAIANDIRRIVIVLLAGLRHIEDHRLNCLAGIAPYEGKALERVHCYLFQLSAKTAIAASHVES